MSSVSKRLFLTFTYLVIVFIVSAVSAPIVTLSQEVVATTTPESISVVDDMTIATTTSSTATTTPPLSIATSTNDFSSATSTNELLPPVSESEKIATTTDEVSRTSSVHETEENPAEESTQPIVIIDTSPSSRLSVREFQKLVITNSRTFHRCEAETFRIDVTGKASATARVLLERDADTPYEVEIGSLPQGIDVVFAKNGAYQYMQGANDRSLELVITNQPGSQKGNFSIPIIYTKKDTKDSSVICQINIVNM
jgi:cytoskeletal protein RodZ